MDTGLGHAGHCSAEIASAVHPSSGPEIAALQSDHYEIHARTLIDEVPVSDVLGYDPFLSAGWNADIDSPVMAGSMRCHLGSAEHNISPYMAAGAQLDGRPLFDSGRKITVETSCPTPGALPGSGT